MTIEAKLRELLETNGLSSNEAAEVIAATKTASPEMEERRWRENVEDYPSSMIAVLWMAARNAAVTWIDANKPLHWARLMFVTPNDV